MSATGILVAASDLLPSERFWTNIGIVWRLIARTGLAFSLSSTAALFVGTMTAQADDHSRPLPVGAPSAGGPIVLAPAPEAVAAPKQPASVQGAETIIIIQDCCPDQQPQRPRKERFNLCDYWEILCACFYRG